MDDKPRELDSVERRDGRFGTGFDARRGRNGGRSARLAEIQRMLDDEHRTVANIREVFDRLKALALGEVITVLIPGGDGETRIDLRAQPEFMKMYLDRVLGPIKQLIDDDDLADAPDAVIEWLRRRN